MRWFEQYGIEKRKRGGTASIKHTLRHESIKPSYEVLKEEYERQSIYELSLKYGVDKHVVSNWLTSYDIDVTTNSSRAENELFEYCKSLDDSFVQHDRSLIGPLELDIVSHTYKLAIEYCGIYWHSETMGKSKQYHREKYLRCRELGYRLLTVFETDDMKKIRALIRTHVGSNQRVYARNTTIAEVESRIANRFHRDHHLSNAIGGSVHLGLYYNDELVMVATFSKTRYNKNVQYECARMTSHSEYTIVGGASRLFKYFFRNYDVESCITYADLRFGEGSVYEHCGFIRHSDSQPNYFYFKSNELLLQSRVKYQKHKLEKLLNSYDPSLSEYDNMVANGYHRIWDCGNAVYIYDP
jgi:G:T-mismatch repair DNA endonuclease (very short patch repair protein)